MARNTFHIDTVGQVLSALTQASVSRDVLARRCEARIRELENGRGKDPVNEHELTILLRLIPHVSKQKGSINGPIIGAKRDEDRIRASMRRGGRVTSNLRAARGAKKIA